MYGDTTLKERTTLGQQTDEFQKYLSLSKDYELLKSKYENLVIENSILMKKSEKPNRVS